MYIKVKNMCQTCVLVLAHKYVIDVCKERDHE